jgi:hypothetical protein
MVGNSGKSSAPLHFPGAGKSGLSPRGARPQSDYLLILRLE